MMLSPGNLRLIDSDAEQIRSITRTHMVLTLVSEGWFDGKSATRAWLWRPQRREDFACLTSNRSGLHIAGWWHLLGAAEILF